MFAMNLLGLRIDDITLEGARQKVRDFLLASGQFKIFTPNPEMIVKAQKDTYFKEVLNRGDLNICDGFGVWLAAKCREWASDDCCSGAKIAQRIPGVDFMLEICKIAEESGKSIYLLGSNSDDVARKTAENLQKRFTNLKIVGCDGGPQIFERKAKEFEQSNIKDEGSEAITKINQTAPDILFVAFGMGKQEKWISENLSKMPSVKIAMGVGGAFDYISGHVKRAPCWMRKIGLEWVYRLIRQPRRIWRILNATLVFCYLVIKTKH